MSLAVLQQIFVKILQRQKDILVTFQYRDCFGSVFLEALGSL